MNLQNLVKPSVLTQPVYEPGKPIADVARELGLDPATIIKIASNENPNGPSPKAVAAAKAALEEGQLYPDGGAIDLRHKLAEVYGLPANQFAVSNGSNEILELMGHVFLNPGDEVVMGAPAFVVYKLVTLLFGAKPVEVPLKDFRQDLEAMARAVTPKTKLVYIASPNNPTGTANTERDLVTFIRGLPDHVVCVMDEAYAEYVTNAPDLRPLIAEGKPLVCLRTFSKIYGLASLRVGYGYGSAEMIGLLNRVRQPFNVNGIGQAAAIAALGDTDFLNKCIKANNLGLRQLEEGFTALGLSYVPSVANFMLAKVGDGAAVFSKLQAKGVIVRPLQPYKLPEWIRVTVGTPLQNQQLLRILKDIT